MMNALKIPNGSVLAKFRTDITSAREFLQMLFRGYGKSVMKERVQKISDNILGYLLYLSEVKDPEGELRKEDLELYRFMEKYAYGKR